jgi:hypothetical protein
VSEIQNESLLLFLFPNESTFFKGSPPIGWVADSGDNRWATVQDASYSSG